eukprot:gene19350-23168_t
MDEVHTVLKTRNKEHSKNTERLLANSNENSGGSGSSGNGSSQTKDGKKSPSLQLRTKFHNRNNELRMLLGGNTDDRQHVDDTERFNELSFQDVTMEQRKIQEEYTREMGDIASRLKLQSTQFSNKLASDDSKINELQSLITDNHLKAESVNSRLNQHIKRSSRDTLNYCFIIVVVLCVFSGTYIFMKLNSKQR